MSSSFNEPEDFLSAKFGIFKKLYENSENDFKISFK